MSKHIHKFILPFFLNLHKYILLDTATISSFQYNYPILSFFHIFKSKSSGRWHEIAIRLSYPSQNCDHFS